MKTLKLHEQWKEFHKLSEEVGYKCRKAEEESKEIKKYKKDDYIILCITKKRFVQSELGSTDIKEYGGSFEIKLIDETTEELYMREKIEFEPQTKNEAIKKANEKFKEYVSLAI